MFNRLFSWFENRVDPYPSSEPKTPRNGLFGFIWSNLEGVRGWLVLLALLSGGICAQPSVSVMIAVFLAAFEYQVGNHIFQVASIQAT